MTAVKSLDTENNWRTIADLAKYVSFVFKFKMYMNICINSTPEFITSYIAPMGLVPPRLSRYLERAQGLPSLTEIGLDMISVSFMSRQDIRWYSKPVTAPPIMLESTTRLLADQTSLSSCSPFYNLALYGVPDSLAFSQSSVKRFYSTVPSIPPCGLFRSSPTYQAPWSPMKVPEGKRLIYDSTKLARLDLLLQELKASEHRVLIYFQMTKMMDLMEEYLVYRQYKYLRLDGSSKLEDRRDMVIDWQTKFVVSNFYTLYTLINLPE